MGEIKTKETRSSNFELLRIIAILMIVGAHYFYFSFGWSAESDPGLIAGGFNTFIYRFGKSFGQVGVALFILISSYFLSTKKFNARSYLKLVLQYIFYLIFVYYFTLFYRAFILHTADISLRSILGVVNPLFNIFSWNNWFMTVYIIFYLIFPFFNIIVNKTNKNQLLFLISTLVITLIVIGTFSGIFIPDNFPINNLMWWITIYFTGAYIRKYPEDFKSIWIPIIGIILCLAKNILFPIGFYDIRNCFYVYFLSLFIFLLFRNLKIKNSKIINTMASTTLGVYVLHDTVFFFRELFPFYKIIGNGNFWLISIGSILAIFFGLMLIDLARQYLIEKPLFNLLDRKLENTYNKINSFFPYEESIAKEENRNRFLIYIILGVYVASELCLMLSEKYDLYLFMFLFALFLLCCLIFNIKKNKRKKQEDKIE